MFKEDVLDVASSMLPRLVVLVGFPLGRNLSFEAVPVFLKLQQPLLFTHFLIILLIFNSDVKTLVEKHRLLF